MRLSVIVETENGKSIDDFAVPGYEATSIASWRVGRLVTRLSTPIGTFAKGRISYKRKEDVQQLYKLHWSTLDPFSHTQSENPPHRLE